MAPPHLNPTPNANPFNPQALQGRVAVVTGAAGGIGEAIVQRLAAMGAQVVAADIGFGAEPTSAGAVLSLRCDIGQPDSVQAMAEAVRTRFGRCDVLVNNAAVSAPPAPLESLPLEVWDRIFHVNLRGALLCAQALVPMMLAQSSGSIVNITSIAAQSPTRVGAYGPAKAGLLGLTRQMAVEWGPRGLRANAVSPGMVRTPLSEVHYRDEEVLRKRTSRIPARRLGLPDDIANAVGFLASDGASYLNGQELVVDGGFLQASLANLY